MSIQDLLTNESFRRHILNPNLGESEYWENWLQEKEENAGLYHEAKSLLSDFYEPLSEEEFQAEAIIFKRKIDLTREDKNNIISLYDQRQGSKNPWILRIAASVLLLISVAFAIKWYVQDQNKTGSVGQSIYTVIEKKASKGQKLTITFPDGTRVKLNSGSSISYPEEFSGSLREVTLSGEAYFDVAHYDNWPFIVKSNDVRTRVLGTSFNVSSYPENNHVEVALVEGKVEVLVDNQGPVMLQPQKMAKIEKGKKSIKVVGFDVETITAWKDNKIIFDKASFDEVQSILEKWYDVEFFYEKQPVFEGGYTGEFADQSLNAVLVGMSANKFNYEIRGNKIFIN